VQEFTAALAAARPGEHTLTLRDGTELCERRAGGAADGPRPAAGFEKVSQEIDPWGMFTVPAARRAGC
jgi:hypothetical protein